MYSWIAFFATVIIVCGGMGVFLTLASADLIRPNRCYEPVYKTDKYMGSLLITRRFIFAWGRYAQNYA